MPEPPPAASPTRITIADATTVFLSNREGAKIAPAPFRKHRTFAKQLTAYTESRGYVMLDQFTSADIDLFYASWNLAPGRRANALGHSRPSSGSA